MKVLDDVSFSVLQSYLAADVPIPPLFPVLTLAQSHDVTTNFDYVIPLYFKGLFYHNLQTFNKIFSISFLTPA